MAAAIVIVSLHAPSEFHSAETVTMKNLLNYLGKIEPHPEAVYRGHADYNWDVKPSIGRHYNGDWFNALKWEKESIRNFRKRSIPYLKSISGPDIEWMCLMQHYGCATRLIDFTSNPLIALFFASDPTVDSDGAMLVAEYSEKLEVVSDRNMFGSESSFVYYPPHITERVMGQSGCFVCAGVPNVAQRDDKITKIKIGKKFKHGLRAELSSMGISHATLFPGLDGVCQDLNQELITHLEIQEYI